MSTTLVQLKQLNLSPLPKGTYSWVEVIWSDVGEGHRPRVGVGEGHRPRVGVGDDHQQLTFTNLLVDSWWSFKLS
jgi:hypothetical protein